MPRPSVLFVTLVFLLLGTVLALTASSPYTDDDIVHHQMARFAGAHPHLFLDIWGRPGFTVLHFLPAQLGFNGSRFFSLTLACLTGLMVARYVRPLGGPYPAVAIGFTFFQATFLQLSFGALTETVYAAFLAAGLLLIQRGRYAWAAVMLSWTAITRLEGMPMLLLFAAYFVFMECKASSKKKKGWGRVAWSVFLLGLFPLIWNILLSAQSGFSKPLPLILDNFFLDSEPNKYGSEEWYYFLVGAWEIHGPLIAPLVFIGVGVMFKRRAGLVPAVVVAFYLMQSILWTTGSFATAGYYRFFVSIAPASAISATYGLHWLVTRLRKRSPWVARPSFLSLILLICLGLAVARTLVNELFISGPSYGVIARAMEAIQADGLPSGQPILAGGYLILRLELDPWDIQQVVRPSAENIRKAAPGSLILFSGYNPSPVDGPGVLLFYDERASELAKKEAEKPKEEKLNWVHRLKKEWLRPEYVELGDFSVLDRDNLDRQPWPFYVKVFKKVAATPVKAEPGTK